jgi:autotransporter-associated beta strand protein
MSATRTVNETLGTSSPAFDQLAVSLPLVKTSAGGLRAAIRRGLFSTTAIVGVSAAVVLATHSSESGAQTATWNGATTAYETNTNWVEGTAPVTAGQSAIFTTSGEPTVNISGPIAPNAWTFDANAQSYNFTGGAVTFSSVAGLTNNAASAISIANAITGNIVQAGTGTLTLSGANTLPGSATVSAGVLNVTGSITTGNTAVNLSGGTLRVGAGGLISNMTDVVVGGAGAFTIVNAGTIQNTVDGSNAINTGATVTMLNSGSVTTSNFTAINIGANSRATNAASGVMAGGTSIQYGIGLYLGANSILDNYGTISGGATLASENATLTGTTGVAANLYAGSNTGTVRLGANSTLSLYTGTGTANLGVTTADPVTAEMITLQGAGTQAAAVVGGIAFGTGGTLALRGTGDGTAANGVTGALNMSNVSGATTLSKQDSGTFVLTGSYGAALATNVTAGRLVASNTAGVFGTGTVAISTGATVELSNTTANDVIELPGLAFTGAGTLKKTGAGIFSIGGTTLSSVGLAQGGLINVVAGTLRGSTQNRGSWSTNNGGLTIASGATFDGVEGTIRVDGLNGAGTLQGAATTTIGVAGGSGVFTGTIQNSTYGGGTFTLAKAGAGTQTLSGTNTYTGGTTFGGGVLNLGSAGAIGSSGALSFTGGTLQYSASNQTDYSARFSNAASQAYSIDTNNQAVTYGTGLTSAGGSLTKLGTGTLVLTGANSYTGGTTISAGTLQIGNGSTTGSITGNIVNNGTLEFSRSNAVTYANVVSGTGSLTKSASGTLTLTGANTYSGGTTFRGGSVNVGSAGALGSTGMLSFAGGILQYSASNQTDYSARLSNAASQTFSIDTNNQAVTYGTGLTSAGGSLIKLGTGTLTLTGANTYTGGTTVSAGTLQVGNGSTTGSIAGNIVDNGTLAFNRSDALTFAGVVSGTGVLNQIGAGTTTLTGANSAGNGQFTGTANVNAGTLAIDGTFGDTATRAATVNVNSGGTLRGSGTIAGSVVVASGGTVSAGNSPGTLTVSQDYTLNAGSTSVFELGTPGVIGGIDNDLINVGRNLTLGGTLNAVSSVNGAASPVSGEYRLFNYGGSLTGTFAAVTTPIAQSATVFTNIAGQVNLLIANAGQVVQYWDGTDTTGAATGGQGGPGTWSTANTNWTASPTSQVNNAWRSGVGIFGGTGGNVTVTGAQGFQGLQFTADGYNFAGPGTLNLAGDPFSTPVQSFINVDAGVGVSVANEITSTGGAIGLVKLGAGTLTLSGASSYTGVTSVSNGTLAIAAGGSITSDVSNAATFSNAGTVTGSFSNTAGNASNSGTITGASTISGGAVSNSGSFGSTLGLTGGSFANNAGGSVVGTATNDGGALTNDGGTLAAVINNSGTFINAAGSAGAVSNAATASNAGTIASLSNSAGSFANSGNVTGASTVAGGSVSNAGVFGSTLGLTGGSFTNSVGGSVVGTATNNGGTLLNDGGTLAAVTNTAGTFTNAAGTAGAVSNAAIASNAGTVASLVNNAGSFANTGSVTGASTVAGGSVSNAGVFGSTLGLTGGSFANNGGGSVAGITTNTGGALTNNGGTLAAVINSSGTFTNAAGTAGAVSNAATASNAGTIASLANSAGSFANSGTITGASTVSGGTLTTGGTLGGGLTNSATVNATGGAVNGAIANNAGAFNVGGTVTSNATFANASGATFAVAGTGNYTLQGLLTNAGTLTIANGGQLDATAGGLTNTATGTVSVAQGGILRDDLSNAGVVTNSGTTFANVAFNAGSISNTATGMWTGTVAGTSGVISNAGTWTGNVVANTGTLTNSGVWTGSIATSGTFANATGATVSGLVSNSGTTTNSGTFNGGLSNTAGTTVNNGVINGPVSVSGGSLTGSGSTAGLTVAGGAFAPGNGTAGSSMTVNGNLALASAVQYVVQVDPATASFTGVTGTASLGGAAVTANFAGGSYVTRQYTLLTAAGGVTGTFGTLTSNNLPSNFNANLSYDANRAYLDLTLDYTRVGGLNRNQQNVANTLTGYFNRTGGIPMAFGSLSAAGLSQVSGELATGTQQATFDAMGLFMGVLTDPATTGRGGNPTQAAIGYAEQAPRAPGDAMAAISRKAPLASQFEERWTVWAAGYGGSQTTDGSNATGSRTASSRIYGGVAGVDYRISPNTIAGFALAGGGTNFSVVNSGSGRSDLFQAGAFVRHTMGASYLTAAMAYGWQDVTTDRSVGVDRLNARFTSNALSGRLEGGRRWVDPVLGMGLTPYAAAQVTSVALPGYSETAGVASTFGLNYAARDATAVRSELGLRTDKAFALNDAVLTLRSRAAWAHNFDPDRYATATFQSLPGASFVVNGAAQARDAALLTGSAEMTWLNGWTIAATFEGEFSNVTRSYAGKGVVRYGW